MKHERIILSAEGISKIQERIESFLSRKKINRDILLRIRLSVEDNLLELMNHYGEGKEVDLYLKNQILRPVVEIRYQGETFNPMRKEDSLEFGNFSILLERVGLVPQHQYKEHKVNVLSYHLPWPHLSGIQKTLLAVLLAVVTGVILRLTLSAEMCANVSSMVFAPVVSIFLGLIGTVALPVMFFSTVAGIVGVGDRETLGRIGGALVRQFLGHTALFLAVITVVAIFAFDVTIVMNSSSSGASTNLADMVIGFFPKNIIEPFLNGNAIQIVFIALVLGVATLSLGSRVQHVASILVELTEVFLTVMTWVGMLIPFFLFALLAKLIVDDSFSILFSTWKPLALYFGSMAVLTLLFSLYTARKVHISLPELFRRLRPSFLVGSTTMSTFASIATMIDVGTKEFGINRKMCDIATPLAAVLVRYLYAVTLISYATFFSAAYGIEISLSNLIILYVATFIMTIATPSVVGGSLASVTLLFSIVGVPIEAIAAVALLDVIMDLGTGLGVVCVQMDVVLLARKLGMMEKNESDC